MPHGRNPGFVGCEEDIKQIGEAIPEFGTHRRFALVGLGGIGKRGLARNHTYRLSAGTPKVPMFLVQAQSKTHFEQSYRGIANVLKLSGMESFNIDAMELVKSGLRGPDIGSWLMILDDVNDPFVLPLLLAYLPQRSKGTIIITTRSPSMAVKLCGTDYGVRLSPMVDFQAQLLLASGLCREEGRDMNELVMEFNYLPLATKLPTSLIEYHRIAVTRCLKHFRETAIVRQATKPTGSTQDHQSLGWQGSQNTGDSIRTSWEFSYRQLRRQHGKAAEFLSFLATPDEQWISKSLLGNRLHRGAEWCEREWNTLKALDMTHVMVDDKSLGMDWDIQRLIRNRLRADEEAGMIYWRALEDKGRILGQKHPRTLDLIAGVSALASVKARLTVAYTKSQPAMPSPIQRSRAGDFSQASLMSGVPGPASEGPTTTSIKPSTTSLDSAIKVPHVVEVFIESLVENEMLAPLFVAAAERKTLWYDSELEGNLTELLEDYSGELRIEAVGALLKTAAALIHDQARQISKQILHNYRCVGNPNHVVIRQPVIPSAEVAMNTLDQTEQRIWQQILASARGYAVNDSDLRSSRPQIGKRVSIPTYDDQVDAAEHLDEEFGTRTSISQVQEFMISGDAFRHLRSSLRQLVVPDMMKAIRQEVVSDLKPFSEERYSAIFTICWEVQEYINQEFDPGQTLGSVLTVTGNAKNAYATSCAEYMRWNWPTTGPTMLEIIQTAVLEGTCYNRWTAELPEPTELHAHVKSDTPDIITVQASGSRDALVEIAQQLGWLAASFRVRRLSALTYSEIHFRRVDYAHFQLDILDLQPLNEVDRMCWHPLFANSVIARGFPIPERTAELGLELPFEVMLRLACIDHVVLHDDAIVLNGFSNILFPTAQYPTLSQANLEPRSIQWHFISSGNSHLRIQSGETLAKHDDSWLKIGDAEVLRTARTFLGYCNAVCIHLGTKRSGYEDITHSPLSEDKPPAELSIRSGSVGTSGLGILGGNLTMQVVLPKSLSSITKVDCYDDILSTAKTEPLLLYDAEKQQGWLVSMLSVILHMVHAWASEHVPNVQIPHANLDWNGGQAAFDVIAEHSKLELRRSLEDDTPYYVKDLVKRLWYDLISCVDAMSLQTNRNRGSVRVGPPRLRGWEFRDIIDPPVLRRMKEDKLDSSGCGWDLLAEDILVLVCQGLGEVIQPAEPEEVCRNWCPVPRGRRYLTASVACLQQLSKRRGMGQGCTKLTDTLLWQPPGDLLFQNCVHGVISQCSKLPQQLVVDGKLNPASPAEVPKKGAVIFGKSTNKLRKERTQSKSNANPLKGLPILGRSH